MKSGVRIVSVLVCAAATLCSMHGLSAAERSRNRLFWGLEWGYTATFGDWHHYNYLGDQLQRMDDRGISVYYISNANLYADLGWRFTDRFSLAFYAGWAGVNNKRHVFPTDIRATYFTNGWDNDGGFFFCEAGMCSAKRTFHYKSIFLGKFGAGYRFALSPRIGLDFLSGIQLCNDHTRYIYDNEVRSLVDSYDIRRSDALYMALNFSVGITF